MKRKIISFVIAGGILAFSPTVNSYAFGEELQVTIPQRIHLDSPTYNEVINNNNILVRGWALDNSGIKEVKVYIDGNYLGNAQIGIQRIDVDSAFPGYIGGDTSGYSYEINNSIISSGKHTIKVEAVGNDLSVESTETVIELRTLSDSLDIESTQSQMNVASLQPRTYIDGPRGTINNQDIKVSGWALNSSGVKGVKVYIDGKYISNATIGLNRPDVNVAYPGYPGGANSGYQVTIGKNTISQGSHIVKVESIGNDGTIHKSESQINMVKPQPRTHIDGPIGTVNNQDIKVKGWALNGSGVKEVKVYIDGVLQGNANTGLVRTDVDKAYPGYPGGSNSGYELNVSKDKISIGSHIIKVEAIGNDGTIHKSESQINMVKPQPRTHIDGPIGIINNQDLKVKGWALNGSGVKEVKVYIDGILQGNANTGLNRPDVNAAYPGYPGGSSSGYELIIDNNKVLPGKHILRVESIGNDGSSKYAELQIDMVKPANRMVIDSPNGSIILNQQSLAVKGWALNGSGVKEIKVYLDGVLKGNANTGLTRGDVNSAYPGYPEGTNSGFNFNLDPLSMSSGRHVIKVEVIGNDGSTQTQETIIAELKVIQGRSLPYTFDFHVTEQINKNFNKKSSSSGFIDATPDDIRYYMDYNNFQNTKDMYQFLKLDTFREIDVNKLNTYLNGLPVASGKVNIFYNQGQAFINAARKYNIDPVYLVAHTMLETGYGSSKLAQGYEVILDENGNAKMYNPLDSNGNPIKDKNGNLIYYVSLKDSNTPAGTPTVKVYNLFGIGAVDSAVIPGGTTTAYSKGWTTISATIDGSAQWISEGYINRINLKQNTLYYMRWYYDATNGYTNRHQYASDINWARGISGLMYNMSYLYNLDRASMVYDIPAYISK